MTCVNVLKIEQRDGYELRTEVHETNFVAEVIHDGGDPVGTEKCVDEINEANGTVVTVVFAYTPEGHYIGDAECAQFLVDTHGIRPELAIPQRQRCSVGWCEREQKWYGWSHRAIYGFGIGSVVDSADHCCATSGWTDEYLAEYPEADWRLPVGFRAESLTDARRMAVAFAESVG